MNSKHKCYILDDEPLAIQVIENHLEKFSQLEIVGKNTEPILAFEEIRETQPDLLFLDIEMPDINGLDLLESLYHKPDVIITTAYREFAVRGFELDVLDYLVKPIPFNRFLRAIDKFLQAKYKKPEPESHLADQHCFIRSDRKNVKVHFKDIRYIEGLKDYVKIVLEGKTLLTKGSLGNFLKSLPAGRFLRIHRSFAVARNRISSYTNSHVEIDTESLPIGRKFRDGFLKEVG